MYRCKNKTKSIELQTSVLITLFLLHPAVTNAALQLLACRTVADKEFLESDFTVRCDGKDFTQYQFLGNAMLCVFTFGIPIVYFFKMRGNLQGISRRRRSQIGTELVTYKRVYGYLFDGFLEKAWYWEIWNSVRKCLITACSVLFQTWGLHMQTWSALGLLSFSLAFAFIQKEP